MNKDKNDEGPQTSLELASEILRECVARDFHGRVVTCSEIAADMIDKFLALRDGRPGDCICDENGVCEEECPVHGREELC